VSGQRLNCRWQASMLVFHTPHGSAMTLSLYMRFTPYSRGETAMGGVWFVDTGVKSASTP